jgi:Domain of unknown function (DUF4157)/HNH/ENDO VII superfamily nuclease with conserved GHE residues
MPTLKQDFCHVPVHRERPGPLQAKLPVNPPGDAFEQEADQVADRVLDAPGHEPPVRRHSMARPPERNPSGAHTMPPDLAEVVRSPGRPLDADTRAFLEPRFGRDFSTVRVHADVDAARSASDIRAHAYTVGNHIVFGGGMFSPATHHGRRLLAHELTHVVQQTSGGQARASSPSGQVAGVVPSLRAPAGLLVQRQMPPGVADVTEDREFVIEFQELGYEKLAAELIRRGILRPGDYNSVTLFVNAYWFMHGEDHVLEAYDIRNDNGVLTGYRIISHLHRAGGAQPPRQASTPQKVPVKPPPTVKKSPPSAKPEPSAKPVPQPAADTEGPKPTKTTDEMRAEFDALPDPVKDLLRGGRPLRPEDLPQLLRIAAKLKQLQPEDLRLYELLAAKLATDLDAFERSVDAFIQFKSRIQAQAGAERQKEAAGKEPTLEEKLSKTWSQFDEKQFGSMSVSQKEDLARDIAGEQRNIQLQYMAEHPGETAVEMGKGMVRLDKTAQAIADDVREAADGNKGAYARLAGGVGAYNKYMTAVASIVFVALLFVPGVNLAELALAGLTVAAAAIALSATEAELRIKAAGEAKTPEEFKAETAKSAAAQTQMVVAAAMLALSLVAKVIARIPLPGRLQNVGTALRMARSALLEKSGVGPAWQGIKADLLAKLRSAKQGLPEAMAQQQKTLGATATAVDAMSDTEFLKHLADGDPALADLGIPPEQARAMQQVAATAEGKNVAGQLRSSSLQALRDAPVEAAQKVDRFLQNVDDSAGKVEAAQGPEQLKSAVDDADKQLGSEAQTRQAISDEEAFVKKRVQGARRSAIREQAQKNLRELQAKQAGTEAEIARLDRELSDATIKVNRLRQKVFDSPLGSEARSAALKEFNAAKQALAELREADELGGFREERARQAKAEEAILESLELKRPALWESTKAAIRKAAKTLGGKFLDANTGEVIEGEPVYGHIRGKEHRRLVLEATAKGMSQEQFNNWVNEHPEWFQLETRANNESHRFEKPGID